MQLSEGVKKLRDFLKTTKVSRRKAAKAVSVSNPTMLDWLAGRKTPTPAHRQAIAIWTGGAVPECGWASRREREAAEKAGKVVPYEPTKAAS